MNWKDYFDVDGVRGLEVSRILEPASKPKKGAQQPNLWVADPYIGCPYMCSYCYARNRGLSKDAVKHGDIDGHKMCLIVKHWPALQPAEVSGKKITIGVNTDPYNPMEGYFRATRTLMEELENTGAVVSIVTRSDGIRDDLAMLSYFGSRLMVAFSINTLDEKFVVDNECSPMPGVRIETMRACKDLGILTACFVSPYLPGITDMEEIIEKVQYHCDVIWVNPLRLPSSVVGKFTGYISSEYSELFPLYQRIYKQGDRRYWIEASSSLRQLSKRYGLEYSTGKIEYVRAPMGRPTLIDYLAKA